MSKILVAGAGKIGSLISQLLASVDGYEVLLIDSFEDALAKISTHEHLKTRHADVSDQKAIKKLIQEQGVSTVVACLPYFCNIKLATVASELGINYFDLTEDNKVADEVAQLAEGKASVFMSRCGVAPGLVNIMANDLMQKFTKLEIVKLRAGCLPKNVSNALQYALAWSVDGLINEYGNSCRGIIAGKKTDMQPLDDLETVELDGVLYEAFNTSGGVGDLPELFEGKVNSLNYKTLRYPGHCAKMKFLMQDLLLNEDRDTLKTILTRALPQTAQDVMIVYVSVSGYKDDDYIEESIVKKVYPKELFGKNRSAIQITTAASASAVIDNVLQNKDKYSGFVRQESIALSDVLSGRFGEYLK